MIFVSTTCINSWRTFPDNAPSITAAAAKKIEPMGGMPSMLSSQQPGKDAFRAGEDGEKWSPVSSPNKPAAGKTWIQLDFTDVAEAGVLHLSKLI